jgi:hypothetical protein
MKKQWLANLDGSLWAGKGELWLDSDGNNADLYDCQLQVENKVINYTWSYENETKIGSYTFNDDGAIWVDSW